MFPPFFTVSQDKTPREGVYSFWGEGDGFPPNRRDFDFSLGEVLWKARYAQNFSTKKIDLLDKKERSLYNFLTELEVHSDDGDE